MPDTDPAAKSGPKPAGPQDAVPLKPGSAAERRPGMLYRELLDEWRDLFSADHNDTNRKEHKKCTQEPEVKHKTVG